MLKRFSSLALVLVIGSSVFAGTARLSAEHVCKMPGMEGMAGMETMQSMETMPCCKGEQIEADQEVTAPSCCVTESQESGPTESTSTPRSPSFSIALSHPAIVQPVISLPKPGARPDVTPFFLPNLQASYVRNLSFLI